MTVSGNALQRLREAGVRPTVPRIAVLQVFDDLGDQPLSVEEVFRRISERGLRVSLGTVYRSVRQMEAQGYCTQHTLREPSGFTGCRARSRLQERRPRPCGW